MVQCSYKWTQVWTLIECRFTTRITRWVKRGVYSQRDILTPTFSLLLKQWSRSTWPWPWIIFIRLGCEFQNYSRKLLLCYSTMSDRIFHLWSVRIPDLRRSSIDYPQLSHGSLPFISSVMNYTFYFILFIDCANPTIHPISQCWRFGILFMHRRKPSRVSFINRRSCWSACTTPDWLIARPADAARTAICDCDNKLLCNRLSTAKTLLDGERKSDHGKDNRKIAVKERIWQHTLFPCFHAGLWNVSFFE